MLSQIRKYQNLANKRGTLLNHINEFRLDMDQFINAMPKKIGIVSCVDIRHKAILLTESLDQLRALVFDQRSREERMNQFIDQTKESSDNIYPSNPVITVDVSDLVTECEIIYDLPILMEEDLAAMLQLDNCPGIEVTEIDCVTERELFFSLDKSEQQ